MGDAAASGGYYTASACNKIYANGSTLTGSIGVISQFISAGETLKKIGVKPETIVSGEFKDAGSPFRDLRPKERQLFQTLIYDVYNQFVTDVVAGRREATNGKLTKPVLKGLADGRVYTGNQAKANMLIDEIGGLHEAIEAAAKLGNVTGTPRVRKVRGGGLGSSLDADMGETAINLAASIGNAAGQAFAAETHRQFKAEAANRTPQLR
jgi:protease-4